MNSTRTDVCGKWKREWYPLVTNAARELREPSLEDALRLVHLYAERGSPKYEKAAMRWLGRYLDESSPSLGQLTRVTQELSRRLD